MTRFFFDRIIGSYCYTNVYVGECKDECGNSAAFIIDPADGTIAEKLESMVKNNGDNLENTHILLTHGHFDHTGAVAVLKKKGAKVYISETDYQVLKNCGFDWKLDGFPNTAVQPFEADVLLRDGDEINIGGTIFRVISTPGHTPGSVCFVTDDPDGKGVIFSGDTLFRMSVGRTDMPFGDGAAIVKSLQKLFAIDGDYDVYSGHGEKTTLDFERRNNPYAY